jgi:hypothetical protein
MSLLCLGCAWREGLITTKTFVNVRVTQCRTTVDPMALTVLKSIHSRSIETGTLDPRSDSS